MTSKHALPILVLSALVGCHDASGDGKAPADRDAAQELPDAGPGADAGGFDLQPLKSDVERDTTPDVSAAELTQLGADNEAAALTLFKSMHKSGENLIFSPHSISTAFAMAYAGAEGTTRTQIASVLNYKLPDDKLHAGFNALELALASRNLPADEDSSALTWEAVNALWAGSGSFKESYLDLLAANYGTGVYNVDLSTPAGFDIVNQAVEAWTHGRIKKFLTFQEGAQYILTNTVYLNAPWDMPFEKESTSKRAFTLADGSTQDVDMMKGDVQLRAANVDGVDVVSIPYRGQKLELALLMPPREGYADFVATLDPARLDALIAAEEQAYVYLSLPKFKIDAKSSLKGVLSELGMVDPFGPADFSRMVNGMGWPIMDVIHQANIEVSEEGTEAAAATAIIFGDDGSEGPEGDLEINRPFVFALRDAPTGTLLFLGTFEKP